MTSNSSAIRKMFEEGKRLSQLYGKDNVFDFSLGNPSIETPARFNSDLISILNTIPSIKVHGYMSNSGHDEARKSVSDNLRSRFNVDYRQENIIMTAGAAAGLNCCLQSLLDPDDEVIVCAPFFAEYKNYIENWQGKVVVVNALEPSFLLPINDIERSITKKTKAIIVNNPNNPTGVVYPSKNIDDLSKVLIKKQKELGITIYIVSDEPYREIAYDNIQVPFIPIYYENTLVVYSWSKTLSLAGERIGYIAVHPNSAYSKELCSALAVSNRIIGFVNAPSLMQLGVTKSIDEMVDIESYNKNRTYLYNELTNIGYQCVFPQGAFYLWIKTPCEENEFVKKALKYNLLVVPGYAFSGNGYVRLAYCVDFKTIEKSIPLFKKLWADANS